MITSAAMIQSFSENLPIESYSKDARFALFGVGVMALGALCVKGGCEILKSKVVTEMAQEGAAVLKLVHAFQETVCNVFRTPLQQMQHAFQERGLVFQKPEDGSNQVDFICSDSCFADVEAVLEKVPQESKESLGRFFYSPVYRAICYKWKPGESVSIEYPDNSTWIPLLQDSRKQAIDPLNRLLLTEGKECSEENFVKDPLFKSTLEKHSVFRRLCTLRAASDFEKKYAQFLESIQGNALNWAEPYRANPLELAYLSLFAYLDGVLDQESLFVAQMLASAFSESPDSAEYTLLTEDNLKEHLKASHHLTERTESFDMHCLKDIEDKPLLKRMSISFRSSRPNEQSMYNELHDLNLPTMGIKPAGNEEYSVTLLSPQLTKSLYAESFPTALEPPTQHKEYYGYRRILSDLLEGRPISYASPLFYMPEAHELHGMQLGVTAHDVIFHCTLDYINPNVQDLIALGLGLKKLGEPFTEIAVLLLDRSVMPVTLDFFIDKLVLNKVYRRSLEEEDVRAFWSVCSKTVSKEFLGTMKRIAGEKYFNRY